MESQYEPWEVRSRIRTEDYLQLGPGQPFGNAAMLAIPVSQSGLRTTLAMHVKGIGIGEDILVAVSGLGGGDDTLTSFDLLQSTTNQ